MREDAVCTLAAGALVCHGEGAPRATTDEPNDLTGLFGTCAVDGRRDVRCIDSAPVHDFDPMAPHTGAPTPDTSLEIVDPTRDMPRGVDIGAFVDAKITKVESATPDEPILNRKELTIYNPKTTVTAALKLKGGVRDPSALVDWQIGLSHTRRDFSVCQYEKSHVWDKMLDVSGGPAPDLSTTNHLPFENRPILAGQLSATVKTMDVSDTPQAKGALYNAEGNQFCFPVDRLRYADRFLDFTTHVLAYNEKIKQVRPLAYVVYKQDMTAFIGEIDERTGRVASNKYITRYAPGGEATVKAVGQGMGPYPPEVAPRGGRLANDFKPVPNFVREEPC